MVCARCDSRHRRALRRLPRLVGLCAVLLLQPAACTDSGPAPTLTAAGPRADSAAVVPAVAPAILVSLVERLQGDRADLPRVAKDLLAGTGRADRTDPNWPVLAYLVGETQRHDGDVESARHTFADLASWAVTPAAGGPYGDTWGGSGLATVALWRWLQILDDRGPREPAEVDRVLDVAERLRRTRLYLGMVQSELLPALPLLEERIADLVAHVAWNNGRHESARSLFMDFLSVDSGSATLDSTDRAIEADILDRGLATRDRFELYRARREIALLKTQADKDAAADRLWRLWRDEAAPADVRAEAGYEWANYNRSRRPARQLVPVLTQVIALAGDRPIAARALYRRGLLQDRDDQIADLDEVSRRFPRSRLADDALFQVATEELFDLDLDRALAAYEKLRNFEGPNDYQDSAFFLPALGLIARGHTGDLAAADRLLAEYVRRHPDGAFRLRSIFWRGRIAERRGDSDAARRFFSEVVGEAPYDYYGVRARMHLDAGAEVSGRILPAVGSAARIAFRQAFRASHVDSHVTATGPYHVRVEALVRNGLYERLLEGERALRKTFGRRVDDIPLSDLDARGLLPTIALLVALRQDALAARDSALTAGNWLTLAGLLGPGVHDWPTSLEMTITPAVPSRELLSDLQRDPRYLVAAYPDPDNLPAVAPAIARAAWPINGSKRLSECLMYALMRQESRFYPGAISRVGALGLLQIMPATFSSLNRRWHLAEDGDEASPVGYLLDPAANVALWARWWRAEFAGDDLATAIMKHNAGAGNVAQWTYWRRWGVEGDTEFRVETVRFPETRGILRRVLRDLALVDAAGYFDPGGPS